MGIELTVTVVSSHECALAGTPKLQERDANSSGDDAGAVRLHHRTFGQGTSYCFGGFLNHGFSDVR